MNDTVLHGGEAELQELKEILLEKRRYITVLDSMEKTVEEQKQKIEVCKTEMEKEISLEIKQRREALAAPYHSEIASFEEALKIEKEERNKKRKKLVDELIKKEEESYKEQKDNLEAQRKLVSQTDGVPSVCTSKLFLAFFCPRTGKEALILVAGLVILFLVLPLSVYFFAFGGNNHQILAYIYLAFIAIFYTLYLLINNLVKDKYLVGINKLLKILDELKKLEETKTKKMKELESIPDSKLDLSEFDEEIGRLQESIENLNKQKSLALVNFDSDEQEQLTIGKDVQKKFKSKLEKMKAELSDSVSSYKKLKAEYESFLDEKRLEERYGVLLQAEPDLFNQSVIDELMLYLKHGEAETIRDAIIIRMNIKNQSVNL